MLVFEFKAYGKVNQFKAIDQAIRTTQFLRNKAIRLWMDLLSLGLNSRGTVQCSLKNLRLQTT